VNAVVLGDGPVARAVAAALRERGVAVRGALGDEPLDMLFLGLAGDAPRAPVAELDPTEFARALEEGLTSRFLVLSEALPLLAVSRGRAVVEVAAAARAPAPGTAAEAAVGAALIGLARAAALEYAADGVRVNVLLTAEPPPTWPVDVTAGGPTALALALLDISADGTTGAVVACEGGVTAVAQLPAEIPDAPL
jgi:NAD(P)-dependent dehydrogenase (short-subunit alcohol dehydrogenase family)